MADMQRGGRATVTAAAVAAAVTVTLAGAAVSLWCQANETHVTAGSVLSATVAITFTLMGAVVVFARPENRVGWLLLASGVGWAAGNGAIDAAYYGLEVRPGSLPGASAWALVGGCVRDAGWYLLTIGLPTFFPDGRVAGPRWRWLPWALLVAAAGSVADTLTAQDANLTEFHTWHNPLALPGSLTFVNDAVFLVSFPLSIAATVAAVVQMLGRWRAGDAVRRQQLAVFGVAAALPVVAAPIALTVGGGGWVFSVTVLPLPVAVAFAVLARGLYDLRTAANRTLAWLTLSAVVAGLYAVVIAGLGTLLDATGASWLPWVAGGVVALAFAPLRDGLQHAVNRLTFGRWDEPYDVLAALGQRLEATADVDRLIAEVVAELRGLGLGDVTITDPHGRVVAGLPAAAEDRVEVTLSAYGRPVGTLRYRPPETPLRARDRRLLDDLGGHLGGVLHARQLTGDLQYALERAVVAREEERRRLRRDLHDGLGPALAGHLLRLDVIAGKLGRGGTAAGDVEALREDLRATMLEVRRVVEGLRPPALDDLGLAGALRQAVQRLTAGTPVAVQVAIGELPPLPAAMEVAVFRIVIEAVTNAVRHAGATACRVGIESRDGALCVDVRDDGRGFDRRADLGGHGLHTMRERAEELRGRLTVSSADGTTIRAELPLPPAPRRVPPVPAAVGER